ncbi:MAG TPA: hypothetical protein VJM84_03000 [Actinomycetota bacterium]|nr:hypothetical protein [Actinomycetota bacterium]
MEQHSCLSFAVDCDVLWKGAGVTIAGFILFIGSVYVLLAAIFGRWMGYLVLAVAFFGWMTIQSSLWLFGFWSQGPETPTNLGPRGPDPAWVVDSAGLDPGAVHEELASYPSGAFPEPDTTDPEQDANVQQVTGAVTSYLAEHANEELGLAETDVDAIQGTSFVIDDLRFVSAADGGELAVAEAHFGGGGPSTTVTLHNDPGQVWHYSVMFLAVSLLLLIVHIPLLDRAERTRKAFLVGGSSPPWYGPA